eukprot:121255-Prorocentrum_minimum.AAC.1
MEPMPPLLFCLSLATLVAASTSSTVALVPLSSSLPASDSESVSAPTGNDSTVSAVFFSSEEVFAASAAA